MGGLETEINQFNQSGRVRVSRLLMQVVECLTVFHCGWLDFTSRCLMNVLRVFEVGNGRVVIGTSESIRSRRKPTQ
jgi:hypothetical protein